MATVRSERIDGGKRAAVAGLFALSSLIIAGGVAFGVYSWIYHISFMVMSNEIPGFVFAAVAVFLGVRYFLSVLKMRRTLNAANAKFNWNNFKPVKKGKKAGGLRK